MTYSFMRWAARQSQKKNTLRSAVNLLSKIRTKVRQGGLTFLRDEDLLEIVMKNMKKEQSRSHHHYVQELKDNKIIRNQYDLMCEKYKVKKYKSWEHKLDSFPGNIAVYYGLIRELKPNIIVETGTATGSMTSYLLAALNKNNNGRLISLDLPPVSGKLTMDLTLSNAEVGYWIPDAYKDRWTYLLGDSKITLPRVMVAEKVDFFIHDSLHTRSHMLFEYSVARVLMPEGGIIASDDILWNNSYDNFLMINGLTGWAPNSNPNIGVTINKFDKFETKIGTGISSSF
jgi:predicted O-methyltransferase YrrM